MTHDEDDHLPPPAERRGGSSENRAAAARGPAARPYAWGDRLLFGAVGLLLGFAAAYGYLENARVPAPAGAQASDPHVHEGTGAAAPGASQMSADPEVRRRLAELQAAVKNAPADRDLLVRLGNAAFDADEHSVAIEAYERALAIQGADANVLTDLGVSYRSVGDGEKAIASFDRALAVEPDHWQALFNQAIVYGIDRGDKAKARALLAKLKGLKPRFPEIPALEQLEAAIEGGTRGQG